MPRTLAALRAAPVAWALGAGVCVACTTEVRLPCDGVCGPGTECVADRCEAVAAPPPAEEPTGKRKRRGKRGRKGTPAVAGDPGAAEAAGEVEETAAAPPPFVPVDDSRVPQFSNAEPQALDMKAGSERLSESELDRHFAQVTPQIQRCVTTASAYGDIGAGSLKFKLRVLPSGKVESVSLTAPASLRVWGIPSCARRAVYDHRFPSFDGAAMAVTFGVDID
ncbi:MAG TPA: hypothetical protein VGB85_26505 [Nannocystis sp.]